MPELRNQLLGVNPLTPGFATWSVQPQPGTVAWARGQLPMPHGALHVSWTRASATSATSAASAASGASGASAAFTLTLRAPGGTSGTVSVPALDGGTGVVRVEGHVVDATPSGGHFTVPVGAGQHLVTVTPG